MSLDVNSLPKWVLQNLNSSCAILFCSEDTGGNVLVSSSLRPEDLHPLSGVETLEEIRVAEGIHALTLAIVKVDHSIVHSAATGLNERFRVIAELDALLRDQKDIYVAYVVSHFNSKPLDEFTVFIGGDCYRSDQPSLSAVFERTKTLAGAMIRKGVMIFPDIPALHGGKKGEWIVLDGQGHKIEGLSESAVVALGSVVIPHGIGFLNSYKEQLTYTRRGIARFPETDYIRPDSGSPDVISGRHWKEMCHAWHKRQIDLLQFTCVPPSLSGPLSASSRPTAYGLATTAVLLAGKRFAGRDVRDLTFVLEALGGVGTYAIEALVSRFEIPAQNIYAFDPDPDACQRAMDKYHIRRADALSHEEFYSERLHDNHFDVWINNGLGDNTRPENIASLVASGVRLFCGAANNILEVSTREESLEVIFNAGGWVWPDEAASGGGWTLAVVDMFRRCQGMKSNDIATEDHILQTIISRNKDLVEAVLEGFAGDLPTGRALWQEVNRVIDDRVRRTTQVSLSSEEILLAANVKHWSI